MQWWGCNFAAAFENLTGKGAVEKLSPNDWDVTDSYSDVVSAVKKAGGGSEVAVYRVEVDHTRKLYFVVAINEANSQLVGVKVLAVES